VAFPQKSDPANLHHILKEIDWSSFERRNFIESLKGIRMYLENWTLWLWNAIKRRQQ